ncbi:MAG: 30S ribosome-binding factor RbfA [Anaerovoracaceae bacterium]
MGKGFRADRIGEEIKRIISEMLIHEIRDPRVSGMVSVNAVDVSPDGRNATVFLSRFSETESDEKKEEQKAELIKGMENAKGLIKKEISRQMRMRYMPELRFKIDESFEYGMHISNLIKKINE